MTLPVVPAAVEANGEHAAAEVPVNFSVAVQLVANGEVAEVAEPENDSRPEAEAANCERAHEADPLMTLPAVPVAALAKGEQAALPVAVNFSVPEQVTAKV
jgi:hypothetical protein